MIDVSNPAHGIQALTQANSSLAASNNANRTNFTYHQLTELEKV
jgi:hypothetical protein